MSRIRINTERIREVGQRLLAAGDALAAAGHDAQSAVSGLDSSAWSGFSRLRAEDFLAQVHPTGSRLAEAMHTMGQTLLRAADTFEQQDAHAAHALAGMGRVGWDSHGAVPTAGPPDPDFAGVRHAEGAAYGPVNGQPFLQGFQDETAISPNDVTQGAIGDCYLMASLSAIARQNPEAIRRMIHSNDDGSYTVTLYERSGFFGTELRPVEVVVPAEFPLRDGIPIFAGPGDAANGQQELWPMLIERAYAQRHGGYDRIVGGWANLTMEELTGVQGEAYRPASLGLEQLAGHLEAGHAVTVASLGDHQLRIGDGLLVDFPDTADRNPLYQAGTLAADHEYYVVGVDVEAGTVSLGNPWGWRVPSARGEIVIPFAEFQSGFRRVSVNPIGP